MIWIFAAVVLALAVYNRPFRQFLYWVCGIGLLLFLIVGLIWH